MTLLHGTSMGAFLKTKCTKKRINIESLAFLLFVKFFLLKYGYPEELKLMERQDWSILFPMCLFVSNSWNLKFDFWWGFLTINIAFLWWVHKNKLHSRFSEMPTGREDGTKRDNFFVERRLYSEKMCEGCMHASFLFFSYCTSLGGVLKLHVNSSYW